MKITLWGTRGSLASPGSDTIRYGGNTSCVSVEGSEGTLLILDAGTGIRVLGRQTQADLKRVNILLTHLHMDHVQGIPFFEPLRRAGVEVHIWGPTSTAGKLESRLLRYLSPPLFPVRVRDLLSQFHFHELALDTVQIGEFTVSAQMVIHPNPTVGYCIRDQNSCLTYLPDHEPALGSLKFPLDPDWTSGFALANETDCLIHDSQYTAAEYELLVGFGHSSIDQAVEFARVVGAKQLVPFHHDPAHGDDLLDEMIVSTTQRLQPSFPIIPGMEGTVIELN